MLIFLSLCDRVAGLDIDSDGKITLSDLRPVLPDLSLSQMGEIGRILGVDEHGFIEYVFAMLCYVVLCYVVTHSIIFKNRYV